MLENLCYLEYSKIALLTFVGMNMIAHDFIEISEWASLGFIALALIIGIVVSIRKETN